MSRRIWFASLTVACVGPVQAESVPEFSLDYARDKASHIVVLNADGKVLETWRGDLKAGDQLPFRAGDKPRPVVPLPFPDAAGDPKDDAKTVTGARRVLFLIRNKGDKDWKPAGFLKADLDLATVWVERGRCYAIYQWMNPGDGAHLHALGLTEKRLKSEVIPMKKADPDAGK